MSFRLVTKPLAFLLLAGAALAGCSDIYYDRRDPVSLASGEAMATNRATQMIDPWPPASRRREIAYSGERMQAAHERYRTGCVMPPEKITSSSVAYQVSQQQQQQQSRCGTQAASPPPPAAVQVK